MYPDNLFQNGKVRNSIPDLNRVIRMAEIFQNQLLGEDPVKSLIILPFLISFNQRGF